MTIKDMKKVATNYYGEHFKIVNAYKVPSTGCSTDLIGRVTLIHRGHAVVQLVFYSDNTFSPHTLASHDYGTATRFLSVSNWIK